MMTDGSRLNGCGGASSHSETTPTLASAVAVGVGVGTAGAAVPVGEADARGVAAVAIGGTVAGEAEAADRAANAACPLGDAAAVVELGAPADPDRLLWHPATATPSAAQRASAPNVCFTSLKTRYARTGCNTDQRNGALKVRTR
jgi:hypothetical protein